MRSLVHYFFISPVLGGVTSQPFVLGNGEGHQGASLEEPPITHPFLEEGGTSGKAPHLDEGVFWIT
jgi:hypothetical protein